MFKGFKTYIINGLLSILPILELTELVAIMPEGWHMYYSLGMVLINMWLRTVTTTPPGQSV